MMRSHVVKLNNCTKIAESFDVIDSFNTKVVAPVILIILAVPFLTYRPENRCKY